MRILRGYCKSSTTEEIEKNGFVLTPGRYVGFADEEDDGIPFEEKFSSLFDSYEKSQNLSKNLDKEILNSLKNLLK